MSILVISSIFLWVFTLLNFLLLIGILRRLSSIPGSTINHLPKGSKAPEIIAHTLDEREIRLSDYEGHQVALMFIAPSCQPCRDELEKLEQIYQNDTNLAVKLLLVCDASLETARDYFKGRDMPLPVLLAEQSQSHIFSDYRIQGTPSYYILDENRKIMDAGVGGISERLKMSKAEHSFNKANNLA